MEDRIVGQGRVFTNSRNCCNRPKMLCPSSIVFFSTTEKDELYVSQFGP
ncbi:unnamed protein product [Brassica rapa subsp. trilocularis]